MLILIQSDNYSASINCPYVMKICSVFTISVHCRRDRSPPLILEVSDCYKGFESSFQSFHEHMYVKQLIFHPYQRSPFHLTIPFIHSFHSIRVLTLCTRSSILFKFPPTITKYPTNEIQNPNGYIYRISTSKIVVSKQCIQILYFIQNSSIQDIVQ